MLEIYKGIKIEDEVTIVEKQNEAHQGYLVCKSNKNQLESALNWAKCSMPVLDENGERVVDYYYYYDNNGHYVHTQEYKDSYYKSYKYQSLEGIVHEYENGQFTFSLNESADGSSQGGKLSFWNCTIIAPDGKEFLIGINSECLIQLLKHNTFINGVCQNKVWLGRIKNNVGAFTENMEEFEQGKKDKAIRETKKTSKYEVGTILIPSDKVYCGKFFKTFDVWAEEKYCHGYFSYNKTANQVVNIYSKPQTKHLYKDYDKHFNDSPIYRWNFISSKTASALSKETAVVDMANIWYNTRAYLAKYNYEVPFYEDFIAKCQNSTLDLARMPDAYELFTRQYLSERNFNEDYVDFLKEYFDEYKIPYVIDADETELENKNYSKLT